MSNSIPAEPRHGIAEALRLIDELRRLAYNRSLAPDDAMRRIRDAFAEHDHPEASPQ